MTTLFRPVLIESVKQAEALDWKTPIQVVLNRTQEAHDVKLFEDFAKDFWPDALEPGNRWIYVALVPIEAEEVTARDISPEVGAYGPDDEIPEHYLGPPRTRLVTPWEEAYGIH